MGDGFSLAEPITTTHYGHYSDSGILMSDNVTCYEETTTSVILGSNTNKLSSTSKGKKNASHYAEMEFEVPTIHPRAPPTNDVPTQYADICGHLNTAVIRY